MMIKLEKPSFRLNQWQMANLLCLQAPLPQTDGSY